MPTRPRRRLTKSPVKPATPYDPSVAVRTMSTTARRVTTDRPGVEGTGTRATTSTVMVQGAMSGGSREDGAIIPPRSRRSRPSIAVTFTFRGPDGPFLRDLRQGIDGWVQSPVVRDEPRPSPPPLPAEPSAADDQSQRGGGQSPRLHALPSNRDEVREVAPGAPAAADSDTGCP